ncbi:MAG: type II secretion system F family protein [Opitutae bacterium]
MPKFRYTAIDAEGNQKTGRVSAGSEEQAQEKLETLGYFVQELSVETRGAKASRTKDIRRRSQDFSGDADEGKTKKKKKRSGRAINKEGLTTFTRQMATLLNAGLPLLLSLEVMIRQQKGPFKEVLEDLAESVRGGNTFSDGLEMHPKLFDNLYVNMIRAGEAGGVLEVVLDRLATFMEKAEKTRKKVQSAMVYPAVVVTVAVLVVGVLMVFVVPQFESIFREMASDGGDAKMPGPTQLVINVSNILGSVFKSPILFLLAIAAIVGSYIGFKLFAASTPGKRILHKLFMILPKVGDMVQLVSMSRFTRTFGTLMDSGVPILQAMTISTDIINNVHYRDALTTVHDAVRDGESVTAPMQRIKIFPPMLSSMVEVGEETGQLPEMLNQIADNYDEDIDNAVSAITSIIEPILIVFLAVVVGFIVIALFLPIIGIMQNMGG